MEKGMFWTNEFWRAEMDEWETGCMRGILLGLCGRICLFFSFLRRDVWIQTITQFCCVGVWDRFRRFFIFGFTDIAF
jgi:hypothetical protein